VKLKGLPRGCTAQTSLWQGAQEARATVFRGLSSTWADGPARARRVVHEDHPVRPPRGRNAAGWCRSAWSPLVPRPATDHLEHLPDQLRSKAEVGLVEQHTLGRRPRPRCRHRLLPGHRELAGNACALCRQATLCQQPFRLGQLPAGGPRRYPSRRGGATFRPRSGGVNRFKSGTPCPTPAAPSAGPPPLGKRRGHCRVPTRRPSRRWCPRPASPGG